MLKTPTGNINLKQLEQDISYLFNTAIASSKIKKLTLQEKEKDQDIRPSFNVYLRAPIGSLKSSILKEISNITGKQVVTNITRAGLVGTIDKQTQQYISGLAWECRNNVMILDEFSFGRKTEGWNEFLQLLESQTYGKRFGLYSGETKEEDGDLYYHVQKGRIDLKTRFSSVIASMKKLEWERGQHFKAFISRCNPYVFSPDAEALHKVTEGKTVFSFKNVTVSPEVIIPNRVCNKIIQYTHDQLKPFFTNSEMGSELYLRSIGDIARSYAVWQNLDRMQDIVSWKISTHLLVGKYFKNELNKAKLKETVSN